MSEPATPEPLADFVNLMNAFGEGVRRAVVAYIEDMRPLIDELARIAALPEVQAELRRRKAEGPPPRRRSCHCLCGVIHPADRGICDTFAPMTTVHRWSELTGDVDVPTCGPCAAADAARRLLAPG